MITANEVSLGLLHDIPVLLQVFNLVAVCRSEIGAHASVMSSDDDTASASGLFWIVQVLGIKTGFLVGS